VKFGADLWRIRADGFQNLQFGPNGGFLFGSGATASPTGPGLGGFGEFSNAFASFLLGAPTQAGVGTATMSPGYRQWQLGVYLADTLQLTQKLTLDFGVRYDLFTPLAVRRTSGMFGYDPTGNQLNALTNDRGNVQTDTNNIAPRFGFAYRAMERTVIRGGYGISYFQTPLNFAAASLMAGVNGAVAGTAGGFGVAGPFNALPTAAAGTSATAAPNRTMYFTPTDVKTPYVQSYDLMIEHQMRYGVVASVGYVGNVGRQLPYSLELNAAQPGAGVAGLSLNTTALGARTGSTIQRGSGLTSNYNSLQANLTKRFGQGLTFNAAYTYSRSMDRGDGFTPINNLGLVSNYGPSDFDRTHMFSLAHVWELPFGAGTKYLNHGFIGHLLGPWQLGGIMRWMTGTPVTPTADPTLCNCPGNTARADLVSTGVSTQFVPVPNYFGFYSLFPYSVLNFAFQQPAAGQIGNVGRNAVRTDRIFNYDLSLSRAFVVGERARVELRGEAYNIANSPHFGTPVLNVNSANFGQSVNTIPNLGPRTIQVALKLSF